MITGNCAKTVVGSHESSYKRSFVTAHRAHVYLFICLLGYHLPKEAFSIVLLSKLNGIQASPENKNVSLFVYLFIYLSVSDDV